MRFAAEGMLDELAQVDDGDRVLRAGRGRSEEFAPGAGWLPVQLRPRTSVGSRLVVIDSRNGRVLEPGKRRMVDLDEWSWIVDACHADVDHLLIGDVAAGRSSRAASTTCSCGTKRSVTARGAGRVEGSASGSGARPTWRTGPRSSARSMRSWSCSQDLGGSSRLATPATISVLSGDIHLSYAAEIRFPEPPNTGDEPNPPAGQLAHPQRAAAAREHGDASGQLTLGPSPRSDPPPLRATPAAARVVGSSTAARCSGTPSLSCPSKDVRRSCSCNRPARTTRSRSPTSTT